MIKGRIYTRKSRHLGDPDDPALMAHHLTLLQRLAAERGIEIVETITEIGSGESIEQRPAFRDLLQAYEQGRYRDEVLLVVAVDRLCRGDGREMGRVHDALVQSHIGLVTPDRTYDLHKPDDDLIHGFTQLLARHELQRYKQRVKIKRDHMTREGRCVVPTAPYGYQWDHEKKEPRPDPERFPILQAWCREVLTDSTRVIGERYGVLMSLVATTLRNPVICGYPARRCRTEAGRQKRRLRREEWTWPERPGAYEAACTPAQWQAIQEVLDARTASRSATWHTDGWCRKRITFHDAEGVLEGTVGLGARTRQGRPPDLSYELRQGQHRLAWIPREAVHSAATEALARLFADPERLYRFMAVEQERQTLENALTDAGRVEAESRIATARRSLDRLTRAEVETDDPEHRDSLRRGREAVTRELAALKRQLTPAASRGPGPALDQPSLEALAGVFDVAWPRTPDAEKAVLVRELLATIHVRVISSKGVRHAVREVIGWEYVGWLELEPVRL